MLIGNKSDLGFKREVDYEEGKALADSFNSPFLEISSKEGINIENSFITMVNHIDDKIQLNINPKPEKTESQTKKSEDPKELLLAAIDLLDKKNFVRAKELTQKALKALEEL